MPGSPHISYRRYTDVTVTSPFGSIPWSVSPASNDEEMASYLTQVTPTC